MSLTVPVGTSAEKDGKPDDDLLSGLVIMPPDKDWSAVGDCIDANGGGDPVRNCSR